MKTIINAVVFGKMYEKLLHMSGALEGLSLHLGNVSDDDQVKMPTWVTLQMEGIASTLRCLSALCEEMSGDLEEWELWAKKEGININYDITNSESPTVATP